MTITAVLIDSREPNWVQGLTFGNELTSVLALPYGDLSICCDDGAILLVERKTPDDFLNSLRDERLFAQLSDMKNYSGSKWNYLVVTGDFQRGPNGNVCTNRETGWSWIAVQSALVTIQEMGIVVVFAGGDSDYEAAILRLASRKHDEMMLIAPPRISRVLNISENIVASLPGIGIERLQAVMQAAGGVAAWGLVGLTDETWQCPGIGPAVKRNIRSALGLKPGEEFFISPISLKELNQ